MFLYTLFTLICDQLCGRSKHNFDHIGNRRLRILVANKLEAYVSAPTRRDKSDIISEVAEQVRQGCHGGGFVRKDKDGQWTEVGPTMAREKVSHAFRDSLLKQNRRRGDGEEKEANRARSWVEAQDQIFSMLHLYSESLRTQGGANESHGRRASTTSSSTGTGTTASASTVQRTGAVMQPRQPLPQLYMNQFQQQLHQQDQLFESRLSRSTGDSRGGHDAIMDRDNADNDQIQGNLAQGSIFPSWD
jgi:hypothetical protein